MKSESKGKIRIWKDASAALCEFVGVDPARKWAQCEKERDEWAALAGQYKLERDKAREDARQLTQERDELLAYLDAAHYATCNAELRRERDKARDCLQKHLTS